MSLELYQSPTSVCCQKVQLVLAEKGLEPEFHNLNLREGEASSPDYLKLNSNGVVPTLMVDGRPQIESTVICEYLDEAYPDPPLSPTNPLDRADMRRWMLLPDDPNAKSRGRGVSLGHSPVGYSDRPLSGSWSARYSVA